MQVGVVVVTTSRVSLLAHRAAGLAPRIQSAGAAVCVVAVKSGRSPRCIPVVMVHTHSAPGTAATHRRAPQGQVESVVQGPSDQPDKCHEWRVTPDGKLQLQQVSPLRTAWTWERVRTLPARLAGGVVSYLLPAGFPNTVSPSYTPYAAWTAAGMLFSTLTGVLSMQALLYAAGLGAGSIPLAAALNWVIKDGLGQLGGVLYTAFVNTRFDADPKKWRFVAALSQDVSTLLEICTPLVPSGFLPLAAIANVGKNVSWLSASATRAGIHQTLAIHGNLADVTGKAGSQTVASSTAGTVLGIALSAALGSDPTNLITAFLVLSACHEFCMYQGLKRVVLPTLNDHRLELALAPVYQRLGIGARTSPQDGSPALPTSSHARPRRSAVPADAAALLDTPALPVLPPCAVAGAEGFTPWSTLVQRWGAWWGRDPAVAPLHRCPIVINPPLSKAAADVGLLDAVQVCGSHEAHYIVKVHRPARGDGGRGAGIMGFRPPVVHLWLTDGAMWRDVLTGYMHALHVAACIDCTRPMPHTAQVAADQEAVAAGRAFVVSCADRALQDLEEAGWWVGQPLLEHDVTHRLRLTMQPPPAAEDDASPSRANAPPPSSPLT